jgi:hypothetical protein
MRSRCDGKELDMRLLPTGVKFVRFAAMVSSGSGSSEVITGYANHEKTLAEMRARASRDPDVGRRVADNAFKIGRLAHEVAIRFDSSSEIREIVVTGHADRVFRNGSRDVRDEEEVSKQRAIDVMFELVKAIVDDPTPGGPTGAELAAAFRSGELLLVVNSMGARKPLKNGPGEAPENRRVEIALFQTQSIPI